MWFLARDYWNLWLACIEDINTWVSSECLLSNCRRSEYNNGGIMWAIIGFYVITSLILKISTRDLNHSPGLNSKTVHGSSASKPCHDKPKNPIIAHLSQKVMFILIFQEIWRRTRWWRSRVDICNGKTRNTSFTWAIIGFYVITSLILKISTRDLNHRVQHQSLVMIKLEKPIIAHLPQKVMFILIFQEIWRRTRCWRSRVDICNGKRETPIIAPYVKSQIYR